jgi:hypothetical protein
VTIRTEVAAAMNARRTPIERIKEKGNFNGAYRIYVTVVLGSFNDRVRSSLFRTTTTFWMLTMMWAAVR